MKRFLVTVVALLFATAVSVRAQYMVSGHPVSPGYFSGVHPGALVMDYDKVFLDGKPIKDYEMYFLLGSELEEKYSSGRNLYRVSQGIAIGSVAAIFVGASLMGLSKTSSGVGVGRVGAYLAGGGAACLVVSVPVDLVGLRRMRSALRDYNRANYGR